MRSKCGGSRRAAATDDGAAYGFSVLFFFFNRVEYPDKKGCDTISSSHLNYTHPPYQMTESGATQFI